MHARLRRCIEELLPSLADLPLARKPRLDRIAAFIAEQRAKGRTARLTFICTANSRRSHLAQLWAAAAATYFGVDAVETYSGGTEATAFDARAIAALARAGFEIDAPARTDANPRYRVSWSDGVSLEAFSKRYDDPSNPQTDYLAIMTCEEADASCPVVAGAAQRIALPYDDPKAADGTPAESATYDERSRQIATEMLYLFSRSDP